MIHEPLAPRLIQVMENLRESIRTAGRQPEDVVLMAVTKTHPYETVMEAYHAGIRLFGENRVQEIIAKFPPPEERPHDMQLHLIGHLQSNKVKKIVPLVDGIDSVDSVRLASLISDTAAALGRVMPILLEFNTSGEDAKSGFETESQLYDAIDAISKLPGVSIQGLMTIGPLNGNQADVESAFTRLAELRTRCMSRYPSTSFSTLSMGMSSDYALAVSAGSTCVRLGTVLFGRRD